MNEHRKIILEFLAGYRRTRLLHELAAGLLVLLSFLSSVIFVAVIISLNDSLYVYLRALLFILGGLGVSFILYSYGVSPRRRLAPGGIFLARQVEQRLGKQDLRLVSAVELMEQADRGFSHELISAHLAQVSKSLEKINPGDLVCWRSLKRTTLVTSVALGLVVLCASFWPDTFRLGLKEFIHGKAPGQGNETLKAGSWVGDITLEYAYPSYTMLADRKVEGSDGAIIAMPGTRVKLRATAERGMSRASLKLGEQIVPMKISGGQSLTAQMVIMKSGSYRFQLVDRQGNVSRSPRAYPIQIQPDRIPSVRLLKPGKDMVVRQQDAVEITYDAKDDFGLDELRLVWAIPSRAKGRESKTLKRMGGKKSMRSTYSWALAPLSLSPGEQVQFYLEAKDNDTVLGPKIGRSATVTLKVFSAMENHRDLMKEVQRLWEYMLQVLADHLELEPEARPAHETLESHENLARGLEKLIEKTGRCIESLRKDELAWNPLKLALRNIKARLTNASYQTKWTIQAVGLDKKASNRELRSLSRWNSWRIGILEKDVLYLEDLLDMDRLEDLQHLSEQLSRDQKRLSDLMEKYSNSPDEQTRRAIMDEIARIKQRIARILARQREVLKSIRDEYFNPDALKKLMSDRLSLSSMDRIQRLLMEGKIDKAMAELERLRKQISNLQKAIQKSQQSYGSERYKELARSMQRIQGELSQIVRQQKKLMDGTRLIRRKLVDRLSKKSGKTRKDIIKKVLERLVLLEEHVKGIGPAGLESFVLQQRQEVLDQSDGLRKLLGAKALGQAVDTASDLVGSTARLMQMMKFFGFSGNSATVKKSLLFKKLSGYATDDAQFIYRELRKLVPPAHSMLSEEERKQVSGLHRRQKQLGQRVQQLQEKMRQVNNKAPLFGQPLFDGMQRSSGLMQRAAEKLKRTDPMGAWPKQRDALGELEQIQKQMEKSCKRGGQGQGMPLPMGRSSGGYDNGGPGDMSRQPVEIPGEEDFQAPEKYRKELIDGMKDPVPEEYQPQVQRYYEELVK